jgi:CheY-like chemotaxis protein
MLLAALRQSGYLPIAAAGPHERLKRGEGAAGIDLVVTDLILREASGAGMVRRWRLKHPRLKAVRLMANARALFDVDHEPLSLKGVCDAVASFHHDVTARGDLRRRYSMAFGGVSEELRAQAWELFARLAPQSDGEMNSTNTVILIFAEVPRDDPFDQEIRSRRETENVENIENVRSMTRTWQFARAENPEGSTQGDQGLQTNAVANGFQGRLGLPVSRNSANSSAVIGSLK